MAESGSIKSQCVASRQFGSKSMPRFFFDIREEKRFTLDEDGAVFANAKDASEEALGIL